MKRPTTVTPVSSINGSRTLPKAEAAAAIFRFPQAYPHKCPTRFAIIHPIPAAQLP
jgi:hypothetical protein